VAQHETLIQDTWHGTARDARGSFADDTGTSTSASTPRATPVPHFQKDKQRGFN
jgi:hypothetical protein